MVKIQTLIAVFEEKQVIDVSDTRFSDISFMYLKYFLLTEGSDIDGTISLNKYARFKCFRCKTVIYLFLRLADVEIFLLFTLNISAFDSTTFFMYKVIYKTQIYTKGNKH